MIDPTFGREPFNGGRLEVSDAEVDPEFPGQSDPDRRPPSSFLFPPPLFHYLGDEGGDADNGGSEPANIPLPPLSQDGPLSGQVTGSGDCRPENGKKTRLKVANCEFLGRRPNVFFLYRTIWDAQRIGSDWFLPSTTFVFVQTFPLEK